MEQRIGIFDIISSISCSPAFERGLGARIARYDEVRRFSPIMREILPSDPPDDVLKNYMRLPVYLGENPQLTRMLSEWASALDSRVAMVIDPGYSLVLAQYRGIQTALIPTMICTKTAMFDLMYDLGARDGKTPFLASSTEQLEIQEACAAGRSYTGQPLNYDYSRMRPADQLAMAIQGDFLGEIFRTPVARLS